MLPENASKLLRDRIIALHRELHGYIRIRSLCCQTAALLIGENVLRLLKRCFIQSYLAKVFLPLGIHPHMYIHTSPKE